MLNHKEVYFYDVAPKTVTKTTLCCSQLRCTCSLVKANFVSPPITDTIVSLRITVHHSYTVYSYNRNAWPL